MTSEDYIGMVSRELRDLPWKMRRDLISEISGQLDELPAGTDLRSRSSSQAPCLAAKP